MMLSRAIAFGLEHKVPLCSTLGDPDGREVATFGRSGVAVASVRAEAATARQSAEARAMATAREAAALKQELAAIKASLDVSNRSSSPSRTRRRTSLDPPETWAGGGLAPTAPRPTQRVLLVASSSEYQVVTAAFLKTLVPGVSHNFHRGAKLTIFSVERIQNETGASAARMRRSTVRGSTLLAMLPTRSAPLTVPPTPEASSTSFCAAWSPASPVSAPRTAWHQTSAQASATCATTRRPTNSDRQASTSCTTTPRPTPRVPRDFPLLVY